MKRVICASHTRYVANGRSATLDSNKCSICKKESKVGPLKVAKAFKEAADDLEFLSDNPEYDPHGFTVRNSATKAIKLFVKLIHPSYAKNIIDELTNDTGSGSSTEVENT